MKSQLDSQTIEIPCENCGRKTKKTIAWIKRNSKLTCSCGAIVNIDANQFRGEIKAVEKSLASLEKSFKNLGK